MKLRKEFDSIGKISVPNVIYWGASTQCSIIYFVIGVFFGVFVCCGGLLGCFVGEVCRGGVVGRCEGEV